MGQDCNQRSFRTTLSASIHPFRTGLFATETAIIQPGLQSIAAGQDYLQLTKCLAGDHPMRMHPSCLARAFWGVARRDNRSGDPGTRRGLTY